MANYSRKPPSRPSLANRSLLYRWIPTLAATVVTEYGLHAIERGAVAGINTASRLDGWLET